MLKNCILRLSIEGTVFRIILFNFELFNRVSQHQWCNCDKSTGLEILMADSRDSLYAFTSEIVRMVFEWLLREVEIFVALA